MSPPDSTEDRPGIYVPKPKPDIYTVLLAIALFAILVACILLFLEFRSYGSVRPTAAGPYRNGIAIRALCPAETRWQCVA